MEYSVIDIDPAMDYDAGEEVMGTVEADSPSEAIGKVLNALGVDVLKSYGADEYATHVLRYVDAVPTALLGAFTAVNGPKRSQS